MKRIIGLFLVMCMMVSISAVAIIPSSAASSDLQLAQDTVQGGAVLHCFNWSYNNIKAALPDIAAAGYTAVQTSPVQSPKDYSASYTDHSGQWWKLYQPLGFSVSDGKTWLGTKAQLTSLCTEAESYGIKVIVDVVANHVANNGTDGGTYSYINSGVESQLKNSSYYHTNNTRVNDDSRYNITQYHLGMPDLNTANSVVQSRVLSLLKECVDCGVDGFRFDAAKHIELPTDSSSFKSDFWPNVINGIKTYCSSNSKPEPFVYGEILGSAGPDFDISNYTAYMAVTDNYTGDRALDKTYWKYAPELADSTYYKGASASKSVLWVESHDTYMGSAGSAWTGNTSEVSDEVITRAWAIIGSRDASTSLFFARPNNYMGQASTDTTWKSTEVAEVNKFKNVFNGQSEYIASEYDSSAGVNVAYIERGTKGVVISKLDGGGSVSLTAHKMTDGTYLDHVSGNYFTVSNGKINGTVGSMGVAVVYNLSDIDDSDDPGTIDTLYLVPNTHWKADGARFAAYFFGNSGNTWSSMTKVNDDLYSVGIPGGDWSNVIFCRMNGSASANSWDNKWNQTRDLSIPTDSNRYTLKSGVWDEDDDNYGTWDLYVTACTHSYGDPVWTWSNNNGSAYAAFTCTICGEQVSKTATVTQTDNGDNTVTYTATVTGPDDRIYTKVITETKPAEFSGTLYLKPGTNWSKGNARFAVYFFNNSMGKTWVSMTDTDGDGIYEADVPSGTWQEAIFCRMDGSSTVNDWDHRLDQTNDLTPESGKNCYNVSGSAVINDENTTRDAGQWSMLYTVTWKNYDGEILLKELCTRGSTPSYKGSDPVKASSDQYSYVFSGWDPEPATVTGDADYTAVYEAVPFNASVKGHTISLKDEIGINFYIYLPDRYDADDLNVRFSWGTGDYQKEAVGVLKAPTFRNSETNYMATCYVAARAMTDTVTMTITDSDDSEIIVDTYRVVDYADDASSQYSGDSYAGLRKLLCDMLDYGNAAQIQFGYKAEGDDADLAGSYISTVDADWQRTTAPEAIDDNTDLSAVTGEEYGLKYAGAVLVAGSKTAIHLYFNVTDNDLCEGTAITLNGNELSLKDYSAKYKYIEIDSISAKNIFDDFTLTFKSSDNTVDAVYSAASYYNSAVSGDYADSFKTVMKAMYNYSQSAKAVLS